MTVIINRQQFMNELSRLLAFMFKEDRSEIIKQYNDMLDNAEDEQAMLKSFGSPTRLAVEISRNYSAEEGSLSTIPEAIKPAEAPTKAEVPSPEEAKPENDNAYIDIIEEIRREAAIEEGIEYKPIFFAPEEPAEEAPVEDASEDSEGEATELLTEETESSDDSSEAAEAADESTELLSDEAQEETNEEASEDADTEPSEEVCEAETVKLPEETEEETAAPEESMAEPELQIEIVSDDEDEGVLEEPESADSDTPEDKEPKTKPALAILYAIPAVPIALVLLLAAIIIGLSVLIAAVAVAKVGIDLMLFTFSGMSLLADVMICFGVSIAVLMLAILLLWLAVWLIAVSIPGIVRGALALGRRICIR